MPLPPLPCSATSTSGTHIPRIACGSRVSAWRLEEGSGRCSPVRQTRSNLSLGLHIRTHNAGTPSPQPPLLPALRPGGCYRLHEGAVVDKAPTAGKPLTLPLLHHPIRHKRPCTYTTACRHVWCYLRSIHTPSPQTPPRLLVYRSLVDFLSCRIRFLVIARKHFDDASTRGILAISFHHHPAFLAHKVVSCLRSAPPYVAVLYHYGVEARPACFLLLCIHLFTPCHSIEHTGSLRNSHAHTLRFASHSTGPQIQRQCFTRSPTTNRSRT